MRGPRPEPSQADDLGMPPSEQIKNQSLHEAMFTKVEEAYLHVAKASECFHQRQIQKSYVALDLNRTRHGRAGPEPQRGPRPENGFLETNQEKHLHLIM